MTTEINLDQFTGTERWIRHPFNRRLLHTEGVEYFADKANAYWFIDAIALGVYGKKGPVPAAIPGKNWFGVVLLKSKDGKGSIEVRDDYDEHDNTCGTRLWYAKLDYTNCPEGTWKFYLVDDGEHTVLMLPTEY